MTDLPPPAGVIMSTNLQVPLNIWLKERREMLQLKQEDVQQQTEAYGYKARIGQSYLSKIERGIKPLSELGPEKMDALRKVLKLSPIEWFEITGLKIVTSETIEAPGPNPTYDYREEGHELPESLKIAIEKYGDDYPEFLDPEWQQSLAGIRFRGVVSDSPRFWLEQLQLGLKVLQEKRKS
jgi:transcriptional regulator with XRE-family HTH domain